MTAPRILPLLLVATAVVAENIVFPPEAGVVDVTQPPYSAVGDGKTDCTAAIQKAVDEHRGRNRTLYFPNGTYLLSDSVGIFGGKPHSRDRFLSYQGQSEGGVVLKLRDGCPGFGDPARPRIVLSVYEGESTGDVMHSFVRNLTVDIGAGNPGAVGLRFMSNNVGAMERVTIRSSDPEGAGRIGLDLRQSQNGPALIRHVTVAGFDQGVATDNSFSLVLEHLTLTGQRETGFFNKIARVTLRGLRSENRVPAVVNGKHAHLTLVEANLSGGDPAQAAIVTSDTKVYLRDIRQEGYGHILKSADGTLHAGAALAEWFDGKGRSLFGAKPAGLRLPIEETPEVPWEADLDRWIVAPAEGDITAALQQAIDAGVRQGGTTLCFRPGEKACITGPIRIHGSIRRIVGMTSIINVADPAGVFKDGAAVFTFEDLAADALVVERFFLLGGWNCPAHAAMFANRSGKTIVLKDMGVGGITKKADPGGRWFIQDVSPSRTSTLAIGKDEHVWARQFNPETPRADMIDVDGGLLWLLGLKTEGRATHVVARNGAQVEILGGVSYQSWKDQPLDPPMFRVIDADVSVTLGFYHHDTPFSTVVEETLGGETRALLRADLAGYHLHLYRSGTKPSP